MAETNTDLTSQTVALAKRVAQQVKVSPVATASRVVRGQAYGTETQISQYSGYASAVGEIVYSTDGHRIYLFDGAKQGGYPVAMKGDLSDFLSQDALTQALGGYVKSTDADNKYLAKTEAESTYAKKADIPSSATQQQADWSTTDTTAVTYIKNKPSIPTVTLDLDGDDAAPVALSTVRFMQAASGNTVKSVFLTTADGTAKPELSFGGDTSNLIPKSGQRGQLKGYETIARYSGTSDTQTIDQNSYDDLIVAGTVKVANLVNDETCWTKTVTLLAGTPSVTIGTGWVWAGGSAPTLKQNGILVLAKRGSVGIANFLSPSS